ncbi:MAG: ABC transporter ATP-binding protein [Candidatus Helarchaeota archaeon]
MSIEVKNLNFSYGKNQVLKNISFKIQKGEFLGIIGPNGSGKTTLLKCIDRLLNPKRGKILIDGIDIKKLKLKELAKKIAYVPQNTSLNFDYTAYEIALMGRNPYIGKFQVETQEDFDVISRIFKLTNCIELANRNFNGLSGGERQKVIFSRALVQEPKILLLDEPTTHLDIYNQIEYMELLKKFQNEGLTVIMVIHDLNLAAKYCDKLVLMSNGKIYASGSVDEVLTEKNIKDVFNIHVIMHKSSVTDSIHIVPYLKFIKEKHDLNIHIICGGGSGAKILHLFKNFNVSVGVLHPADIDYEVATLNNYKIITEKPFSPISDSTYKDLLNVLKIADYTIFCDFPIGVGNIRNLESLKEIDHTIVILEESPIDLRDFTNGYAKNIYNELKERSNVRVFSRPDEIFKFIKSQLENANNSNRTKNK